jgi:phosphopantetheine adenylyltransferase
MRTSRQRSALLLFASCIALAIPLFAQQSDSGQSLADVARKLRKDTSDEVKMNAADTKRLFQSVDTIFDFAAEDSGMPKHSVVKRRMVSKADVEKYVQGTSPKRNTRNASCRKK